MDTLLDSGLDSVVIPGNTRSMKFAISVPDDVFQAVEAQAKRMGISRSQFFADAARQYVNELTLPDRVAEINAILDAAGYNGSDEEELAHFGAAFLRATAGEWEWDDSDS
jgi:predicted transcriptional regulator